MRVLLFAVMFLFLIAPANAAHHRHDGHIYEGSPGAEMLTVAQAKNLPDDTYVILTGNIINKIGKEDYIFKDASGEIQVEIDRDLFYGLELGPKDTVRLTGEIDRERNKPIQIDVKHMQVLN